ncbi:MAG: hypothetical protein II936_01670 [Oscillospiraceae bacterium]|nr:hypothetical protein [Oscillospiraceae bacterium]
MDNGGYMKIISNKITKKELFENSDHIIEESFVKAVVDIDKRIIAIDAEMHADLEKYLLDNGSKQTELWGINFHTEDDEDFVEFDSLINIRPRQNKHLYIDDENIRAKILEVVDEWILTI